MEKFELDQDFEADAERVWEKLADFGGLAAWMPGVASCRVEGEGVGAVRSVALGAMTVKERLESLDPESRELSYSIVEGPLPVQNYLARIRVTETGPGRCRVDWSAGFEAPQGVPVESFVPAVRGGYAAALRALKQQLEG